MLSTLIHAAGAAIALLMAVALVRAAAAAPAWWLLALLTAVMAVPVSVLSWAGVPQWIAVLPMAALFAVQIRALVVLASGHWERLQALRRGRADAAAPAAAVDGAADPMLAPALGAGPKTGWWDAPVAQATPPADDAPVESAPVDSLSSQADTAVENSRDIEDDDVAFADLIRRNFTVH
ncbi:hypothetical protein Br6_04771 [Rhodococcus sp. Br-6]|nr:hypothetical protein Br6_04771 [Rhodococcus sp. Br-6]